MQEKRKAHIKKAESTCSHYIHVANMTESYKSQHRWSLAFLTLPLSESPVTSRFLFEIEFIFLSTAQNMRKY